MKRILNKVRGSGALPARPNRWQIVAGLIGGSVGIGLIAVLAHAQNLPLLMAPFGATCVLLFAAPDTPLAQPRNVIGGHLVSSLVGLLFLKYVGVGPLEMGLAVGLAIALMQATRTLHAPAGADPLVVLMSGKAGWSFLFAPVFASAVILVLVAIVVNNVGQNKQWPRYWF
ncbi:HPP family protein [Chromobacterium amazonense]|uniref:HPP family protein n=1 Tax=Chromobacterium amazonense TaxID=1382803 RepID=UPI0031F6A032